MEFLFSNYQPLRTRCRTFQDAFYSLIPQTSKMDIAVGYVSSEALMELKRIVELNRNIRILNLVIGMHYFEKFTPIQYKAAMILNDFLRQNGLGEVRLVNAFKYHGKLYSYSNDNGPFTGIIGSNNLSSIIESGQRTYESSLLIDLPEQVCQMYNFINDLCQHASRNIAELEFDDDDFLTNNSVLDGQESVDKISHEELTRINSRLSDLRFSIPAKTEPKSNLNCYHGKGRENTRTHLVKPRHWYEVELITPISIRRSDGYPKGTPDDQPDTEFRVFTDDGYSFLCKVNGGEKGLWNKNLRSSGDLTILGKWIKGRLESKGVLTIGDVITDDTLKEYGRKDITMTKIKDSNDWFLDFGVR